MSSIATTLALLSLAANPEPAPVAAPAPAPAPAEAVAPTDTVAPAPTDTVAPAPAPAPTTATPASTVVAPPPSATDRIPVGAEPPAPVMLLPDPWEPERPDALRGRWLMGSSIGLGVLGWGLALGQVGVVRGCAARLDGDLEVSAETCMTDDSTFATLAGARALTNISNWGLAGTAGAIRGNYDAIDHVWAGRAPRRSGVWIASGFALAATGMTAGAVATALTLSRDCDPSRCPQTVASYVVAGQAAQTLFTAGIGMAAYGMVYRYEYRDNDAYKNRMASLRAAPTVSSNYAGASVSGRF